MLGRGSFAVLGRFAHGPHEHDDPAEERFSSSNVIFTTDGRWRFHGYDGWVELDRDTVLLGHAGDSYRCAHDDEPPRRPHALSHARRRRRCARSSTATPTPGSSTRRSPRPGTSL